MAYSPFDYMPPSYGVAGEDEEERKRREAEEARQAAEVAGPVEPGPVKQTITYDPVTGEQRMKIEGSVEDLSPKNALTPTVSMPGQMPEPTQAVAEPVAPQQPELQKQFETPAPAPAPAAEPTATGMPSGVKMVGGKLTVAPPEPVQPGMPNIGQPPTPGPGVQVAGPAQMPPQQAAPAPAAATASAAKPTFNEMFAQAGDDAAKFLAMRNDTSLTPEQRKLAGREAARLSYMEGDRGEQEAAVKEKMANAAATGNFNDIAKMMKAKSEEGSWGRRILFGMLGMEAAVKDEEAKLGIGSKWQSTTVTDPKTGTTKNVLVKVRADGLPSEGYDADTGKQLDAKALAAVQTGGSKLNIVGGTYVNDKTGEVGRVVTDEKTGTSYIQTDTGRKPMSGFRPQASGGTMDAQRQAQIQRQNIELAGDWERLRMKVQGAAPEAANKYLGEFNAKHGTKYGLSQLQGSAPQISLETGQMSEAPAAAPAPAQAAPAQAAPQQAAPAPAQAPAPARTPAATNVGPAVPNTAATGQAPIPSGGGGGTPAAVANASELSLASGKSAIETKEDLEKRRNALRVNQPAAESNADSLLRTLNDIMTHPGLDKTIGNPDILNKPLQMIPQGDRRAFKQKYQQLAGQEFLAAYNQLKGGGGISEIEGAKAEQAISALKDTGISPEDFKMNAWILRDVVQTGIDNQRRQLGQAPKYAESPDREQAKEWLRNNPNHPKAASVRKKLVGY